MVNGGQLSEGFERFSVRGKRMRLGEEKEALGMETQFKKAIK